MYQLHIITMYQMTCSTHSYKSIFARYLPRPSPVCIGNNRARGLGCRLRLQVEVVTQGRGYSFSQYEPTYAGESLKLTKCFQKEPEQFSVNILH